MFRLDGGEHGVDPACLTVALILHGGHAVQHFVGKVQRLLLSAADEQHQANQ